MNSRIEEEEEEEEEVQNGRIVVWAQYDMIWLQFSTCDKRKGRFLQG